MLHLISFSIHVCYMFLDFLDWLTRVIPDRGSDIALVAEWLRVRLRVRMVKGSTLTVGNFLSLENLNVIIRAIN